MLSTIKEIGEMVSITERQQDGKVLAILFDTDEQSYSGIDIEDYDSEKTKQYLYKEGASKGNAPSPFCPIIDPEKTFKKIEGWLMQCCREIQGEKEFLEKVSETLKVNKEYIITEISQKIQNLPKKKGEGRFLTCKVNRKYLGEYEIFRKAVEYFDCRKFEKSSSTNKACSVCGRPKNKVGKIDIFKFSSTDKPGFITGGFNKSLVWRNFPVCSECKSSLENGKKFIDTKLNFGFYGLNYYLIPRLLTGSKDILKEILNIISDTTKAVGLKERIKKRITNDENEILEYLSEVNDILTINFLFLRKEQSAERILLLIEDVFPSRIRKIFDAKDYVDSIFGEEFNFGRIRIFFSKSSEGKRENDLNKYFLEIVNSVFKGRKLDYAFLLKFYMATIRKEFINDGYFFIPRVKDALMDTMFFEKLNLITFEEVEYMEESMFSNIFKKYGKSFSNPAKRGVFLLGSLTQLLLNKQWSERNAKPFMKKLKGLKMDEKDIKALLPEVQNKLEEYDAFDKGKRLIASEISKHLLEAGDGWKMSVDEINFCFACGMNLADEIAGIVYSKTEKEE